MSECPTCGSTDPDAVVPAIGSSPEGWPLPCSDSWHIGDERQRSIGVLTVAICTMPNPPSWDEANRIAQWLVVKGMVR